MKNMIHIKRVNEINGARKASHIISEGVHYDKDTNSFLFDFEHDNETDVIKLEQVGYSIDAFGNCYHFGYTFAKNVDSTVKGEFIKQVKFPESFDDRNDLSLFITKAVTYLNTKIALPQYNVIVYPQSLSELNRKTMSAISRITTTKYVEMELVKELPSKIEFDYERYAFEVLDSTINGRPRYTQSQKQQAIENIKRMMENIHKQDYFSIARNVKKNKYRPYIKNFYNFKDEDAQKTYLELSNQNIILLDDIATSGTTTLHLLNTLRCVNGTNNIVVFSLIDNKNIDNLI